MKKESKKIEESIEQVEILPVALNELALGIAKTPEQKWALVTISFDLVSKQAKITEVVVEESKDVIRERFRIKAAKDVMFRE